MYYLSMICLLGEGAVNKDAYLGERLGVNIFYKLVFNIILIYLNSEVVLFFCWLGNIRLVLRLAI